MIWCCPWWKSLHTPTDIMIESVFAESVWYHRVINGNPRSPKWGERQKREEPDFSRIPIGCFLHCHSSHWFFFAELSILPCSFLGEGEYNHLRKLANDGFLNIRCLISLTFSFFCRRARWCHLFFLRTTTSRETRGSCHLPKMSLSGERIHQSSSFSSVSKQPYSKRQSF